MPISIEKGEIHICIQRFLQTFYDSTIIDVRREILLELSIICINCLDQN